MRKCELDMLRAIVHKREWKGSNTVVTHRDGETSIGFHGTRIGTIRDGKLSVSNGGYMTVTTKSRINALLRLGWNKEPYYQPYVYQSNWKWYFRQPDDQFVDWNGGQTVELQDTKGWWWSDALER